MTISYLNGRWQPVEEAKVSVLDRGFLFGDAVYEVIPIYNTRPFNLERHLVRLDQSLQEVGIDNPFDNEGWSKLIAEAITRSGESYAALYLQVTRGVQSKRDFVYPKEPVPTVFLMVSEAKSLDRTVIVPHKMVTLDDFRWSRGHIKTVSLIAAGMLKNKAISQGANDAILVKEGQVTECTSSNIFAVFDGVIVTPPKSNQLLHGITRDVIVENAIAAGMCVEERELSVAELDQADELFLSSSTMEAWPIGELNGKAVGNGEAGIVWHQVDKLFQAAKKR